jgi:hypothetical protein
MSVKGLRNIKSAIEATDGGGVRWFKMPPDATWVVRFISDLDESPATDHGAGVATLIHEHQAGKNFRVKAQCTNPERDGSKCFGCEQAINHPKTGWARKSRVYVNVLVQEKEGEEPYVAVWSIGTSRSPVWDFLVDTFGEEGSISNRRFRFKRKGEGVDTTYVIRDLGTDSEPFDFASFEGFDLDQLVKLVPYEDQQEFYLASQTEESEPSDDAGSWV